MRGYQSAGERGLFEIFLENWQQQVCEAQMSERLASAELGLGVN